VTYPLEATARRLLAAVVACFDDADVDLPARRYVAPGAAELVAHDCEQVTVALVQTYAGLPASAGQQLVPTPAHPGRQHLPTGVFEVAIVRCAPTADDDGEPPDAEDLDDAGAAFLADAALLLQAAQAGVRSGVFTSDTPGSQPSSAANGPVIPIGPEGGFVASRIQVSVQLIE
jgi:hypothetical protein